MKLLVLKNQQFQMKKQDLEPMIQEVVTSMQYCLKEQDILVNLNLKKAICKIEPDLLKSLILNLIDNALKSMNSGGILTVEDRATQEGAKIYISDTGCGMPKDEISKITEAFYRIDKSRSRKQGGVGLGLAICKEIVRIHQGEMRFISQQGKGTTVIITIGGGAYEKQIRNTLSCCGGFITCGLVLLFYQIFRQLWWTKKTFGQSEDLSLNPVEISVEATQTTLEKLKIINNHILSVAVRPSSRTVDGRDVEKTAKKQTNLLLKKMKIAYRVEEDWKITYKKLYTYIKKKNMI